MTEQKFSIEDYAVFFSMLVVSALIGFYYAWKDKGVKTVNQVLLGGGDLHVYNKKILNKYLLDHEIKNIKIDFSRSNVYYGKFYIGCFCFGILNGNV